MNTINYKTTKKETAFLIFTFILAGIAITLYFMGRHP